MISMLFRLFFYFLLIAVGIAFFIVVVYGLFWQKLVKPIIKVVKWKYYEMDKAEDVVDDAIDELDEHRKAKLNVKKQKKQTRKKCTVKGCDDEINAWSDMCVPHFVKRQEKKKTKKK